MRNKAITKRLIYILGVMLAVFLSSLTASLKAHAEVISASRLPGDNYILKFPNGDTVTGDGQDCIPDGGNHGNCSAYYGPEDANLRESHQYINISNGTIDNTPSDRDYYGANVSYFTMLSNDNSSHLLKINLVNRGIGEDLACGNYLIAVTTFNPNSISGGESAATNQNYWQPPVNCTSNAFFIPSASFAPLILNQQNTGKWRSIIRIEIKEINNSNGGEHQASFSLTTDNGVSLGYAGYKDADYSGFSGPQALAGWVNTYPTALADGHRVEYRFRPQCDIPQNSSFNIGWDNLDWPSGFQQTQPTVRLYKYVGGARQLVQSYTATNSAIKPITMTSSLYDSNGNPYPLSVEFGDIRGGNGISFLQPFDSATSFVPCPGTTTGGGGSGANGSCTGTSAQDVGFWEISPKKEPTYTQVDINGIDPVHGYDGQIGAYRPYTIKGWNYVPGGQTVTVEVRRYAYIEHTNPDGSKYSSWDLIIGYPKIDTYQCFHAKCVIDSVVGNGPNGEVVAGQQYNVNLSLTNDGNFKLPNPYYFTGWKIGVTGSGGDSNVAGGEMGTGETRPISVTLTAPPASDWQASGGHFNLSFIPKYNGGGFDLGSDCGGPRDYYLPFKLMPDAKASYAPSDEDPEWVNYRTWVHGESLPAGVAAAANTTSKFYKDGGTTYVNVGGVNNYGNGDTYTLGSATAPAQHVIVGGVQAGDKYCAEITINYTTALLGPGNSVVPTSGTYTKRDCPKIGNKPFFKVYGNAVSANGDFSSATGNTCTGTGKLGGWFNNTRSDYHYGSSSELSALALVNIVGVGSAQTLSTLSSDTRPGDDLSFANSPAPATQEEYSPKLGGNYGNPHCLHTFQLPDSFLGLPSTNVSTLPSGSYKATGDQNLSGGAMSGKVAIFVDGDVYINSNITYQQTGWNKDTVPALVIRASGNIYISRNVTELDGLYIAEPNGANTGHVYTCAPDTGSLFIPMPQNQLYNKCNNQLLVHGSFVASRVNLMRTYGSLRDDKPETNTSVAPDFVWSNNGEPDAAAGGDNCVRTYEPAEPPANVENTWYDNFICSPTPGVGLKWTWYDQSPDPCPFTYPMADSYEGCVSVAKLQSQGYTNCVTLNASDPDTWGDNVLCVKGANGVTLTFETTNTSTPDGSKKCTAMVEPNDPDGQWASGGYYLCAESHTTITVPTNLGVACSNMGIRSALNRPTCAAEVFDFSPEMYLGNPPVDPEDGSGRIIKFQAITGLPPVL